MTRFVALGSFTVMLAACGLRTDPEFQPICKDEGAVGDEVGDESGSETAGTDDATDDGNAGVPRAGSCENPIDVPLDDEGKDIIVQGHLGGCSGVEGWCGGSGGEDVYRIAATTQDIFIEFLPQETNFNPVLRVVRSEEPCDEQTIEQTEVCADITNSVPGRGFYDQGGEGEQYFIIVDTELGESGNYAFQIRFGEDAFGGDCEDAFEEQLVELAAGGNFQWEANLDDSQGRLDSGCLAPGDDDVFQLVLTGSGTLQASVEVIEGDETFQPIVSLRSDCSTTSEFSCGPTASTNFGGSTNAILVVDQLGAAKGRYRLNVNY